MNNLSAKHYISALTKTQPLPFNNLKDRGFQLVYKENNEPVRFFGSSSVVFKITDGNSFYALKCYITELFYRWEYLEKVWKQFQTIHANWIVPFEIYKNELEVENDNGKSISYNIVLMPWIEGNRLTDLVKKYSSQYSLHHKLKELTQSFIELANKHVGQSFSHGDISPENIIVTPSGEMILVDHDSYFFETSKNIAGQGVWSLAYQHPNRHSLQADLRVDHFSFLTLATSLKAIELNPGLFQQFNSSKGLLFSIDDYKNPEYSKVFGEIKKLEDPCIKNLLLLLLGSLYKKEIAIPELLQYLNCSGSATIQSVQLPAEIFEKTEKQKELVYPLTTPDSSLVVNKKGMIEDNTVYEETTVQNTDIERKEPEIHVQQAAAIHTINAPAYQKQRKKTRVTVVAVLSSVLLILLGIKVFFPETKIVNPVDYKKLVSPQNTDHSVAATDTENKMPTNIDANNSKKQILVQPEKDSTINLQAGNQESKKSTAIVSAQTNTDAGQIQNEQGIVNRINQTVSKKKISNTKRNYNSSVTFRKTGF